MKKCIWPLLIDEGLNSSTQNSIELVVLNEKGSISHSNAMPMILRWGIRAYPFSASREEELRKAEREGLNFSSQSSLEMVCQNLEIFQSKIREAMQHGEMIFVCVGSIDRMLEFLPELNYVFYVGGVLHYPFCQEEKEYDLKREEMCSITTLSLCDVYKFWNSVKYLLDELGKRGDDKRTGQLRSMVLALKSALSERAAK